MKTTTDIEATKKFFLSDLNYSLSNEDARLEHALIDSEGKKIAAVSSSGSRLFPLLATNPETTHFFDISKFQNKYCKFKIGALSALSHAEYLSLFGFEEGTLDKIHWDPPTLAEKSKKIFETLSLEDEIKSTFGSFFSKSKIPIAYTGKWERTFIKISKFTRRIMGKDLLEKLFSIQDLEEQIAFVSSKEFKSKFSVVVFIFGNALFFKTFLYDGDFPKLSKESSYYNFYQNVFQKLFATGLARDNYLLNMVFLGKICFKNALPHEFEETIYSDAKKNLDKVSIDFFSGNMLEEIPNTDVAYDAIFLSDVPSYFTGNAEKTYLQKLSHSVAPGGIVVPRYYLKVCNTDLTGYKDITANYESEILKETTGVYDIHVYQRDLI